MLLKLKSLILSLILVYPCFLQSNSSLPPISVEDICSPPVTHRIIRNTDGQPQFVWTYTYDEIGRCTSETVWGNLSGTCSIDLTLDAYEQPIANGIECYTIQYHYDSQGRMLMRQEEDGSFLRYNYHEDSPQPHTIDLGLDNDVVWHQNLDKPSNTNSSSQTNDLDIGPPLIIDPSATQEESFFSRVASYFDQGMQACFGYTYLRLAGYYSQEAHQGSYGKAEIHPYVRTTLINGMGNLHEDVLTNIKFLSASHGDTKIHYIFRPTLGWTQDLIHCAHIKFFGNLGYVSPYAYQLADLWRSLLQDMEGQGQIYHYAHSLGGADTYSALLLLSPEERSHLNVITIGSATLIPDLGLKYIVNYVSNYDFVSPFGYMTALLYANINVIYLEGNGAPVIDHTLSMKTYSGLLRSLGAKFISTIKSLDPLHHF